MTYDKGLQEIGNGLYGYFQPNGSWGLSNAGLITEGDTSLLVDTLFDLNRTGEMLDAMRRVSPQIDLVVNTHANGDHCWGNSLVEGAEIIASGACASEMAETPPSTFAAIVEQASSLGRLGKWVERNFGRFDFGGAELQLPDKTFDGELVLRVGSKEVRLIEVGPAHTKGDVMIHVPADRVLYAGDIVMAGRHPVMWAGPMRNYLRALDRIAELDVDVVVPGHGPLSDAKSATTLKRFLEHLTAEARARFDAGMSALDAARDIPLDDYADWGERERMAVNVTMLYREFGDDTSELDRLALWTAMAELA
jgi:cyclase